MASINQTKPRFLTYRVQNIPYGISEDELKDCFDIEDRDDIKVKSLCPSFDNAEGENGDYTATVFFRPHDDPQRKPRITKDIIEIDRTFNGFTPLYVPPREKGPITVDIIAISGLAGHAFGSWAHSPEHMWLRDYLPRDAPNSRILTYGYPSELQGSTSVSTIEDYTTTFVHSLIGMRDSAECESRPIIFIGHSLGCLIIKKALVEISLIVKNASRFPVRTIIFLAGPHRGLNISALQTLVKGKPTEALIDELGKGSRTLNEINRTFAHVAEDIEILTCYETKPTMTVIEIDGLWVRKGAPEMMVEPDSAHLCLPREKRITAETDHTQIAKIRKGEGGIYSIIKSTIRRGLISTARIVASVEVIPDKVSKSNPSSSHNLTPPYSPQLSSETEEEDYEDDNTMFCDECENTFPKNDVHYTCIICDDGDFNLCKPCKRSGSSCPKNHKLYQRQLGEPESEEEESDDTALFCSECEQFISNSAAYWHCVICSGGDYDVCLKCKKRGKGCPGKHKLIRRQIPESITPRPTTSRNATPKKDTHSEPPRLTCLRCKCRFDSRNKLFEHLEERGHMV